MTNPEQKRKDYTSRVGWVSLAVILLLVVLAFIPPLEVGGVQLRRANILSEVLSFQELALPEIELSEPEIEEVEIDWEQVTNAVAEQQLPVDTMKICRNYRWDLLPKRDTLESRSTSELRDSLPLQTPPEVLIEDYDTTGQSSMRELYRKLATNESVRIAFLGDSFVEGDILTADLREQLQLTFGGCGVGFAPMASPLTGFRRTVKTQAKGWTSHNIMQWQKSSSEVQRSFTVAGWVCHPEHGASTRWQGCDARQNLDRFDVAKVWFLSRETSEVEVVVNDTLTRRFAIEGDEALRQVEVHCPDMNALTFRVLSGNNGFVGHGVQLSSEEGVVVDNYSVRSNNGRAIFWSSPALNAQLQSFNPYDLVVLQYGLNIMQQGVHSYSKYSQQVEQMISYARECFPGAAILVLGVSERWVKGEQGFAPMDALPSMVKWQRAAAQRTGAAFWPTSEAMKERGGMELFVKNGWAGKDYTHINYAGGRQVANALYEALYAEVYALWKEEMERQIRRAAEEAVLNLPAVDSLLFPIQVKPTLELN